MSYGTFHTFIKPNMRYGISFGGRFVGMQMDIDRLLRAGVAKDNILQTLANFNQAQGPRQSANEHLVPEQLFDDPNTKEKESQGISAVKALQIASSQGQTIYTVTKANYAEVLPKLNHSTDVMTDVRNAINAGKEVTISQTQVHAFGWSGTGYIVLDPESGVGAYLIDGGANGGLAFAIGVMIGYLLTIIAISIYSGGAAALTAIAANPAALVGLISILLPTLVVFSAFIYTIRDNQTAKQCLRAGILMGLSGRGIFGKTLAEASWLSGVMGAMGIGWSIPDISNDCYKF